MSSERHKSGLREMSSLYISLLFIGVLIVISVCGFLTNLMKVAELIGFQRCMHSCLEYLEVVPWVGDEEEEKMFSSVLRLKQNNVGVTPLLKRVSSSFSSPLNDTVTHVIELVLKSNEERGRREMKSLVLKHSDSIDLLAKHQRRRQELTQTTSDQPMDDEAVYYKVAGYTNPYNFQYLMDLDYSISRSTRYTIYGAP
ncbi:hypothetical protein Syun_025032 [Stephania yunnanensis]|uniref:Uncharacterized protein n=1 Tax=Stephania yunnanensis TaxID=152371 RepID=A0AAP0ETV5_9MAGN